jgi:hypothetical protein
VSESSSIPLESLPEDDPTDLSHYLSDEDEDQQPPEDDEKELKEEDGSGSYRYKIHYSDNWKILAARSYLRDMKISPPKILVWNADVLRMSDKIPPRMLGDSFLGEDGRPLKNRVRFSKIRSLDAKMHLIKERTYWGRHLKISAKTVWDSKDTPPAIVKERLAVRSFSSNLLSRIRKFLAGEPDPKTTPSYRKRIFGTENPISDQSHRAERFMQMLRTVDGCFVQRYLAFPEESWTWEKYDSFIISLIDFLLGDEFFDSEIQVPPSEISSSYSLLKKIRKRVKLAAHTRKKPNLTEFIREAPQLSYWRPMVDYLFEASEVRYTRITGLLSQTRGCGTPPPIVILQSKVKFIQTVTEVPPAKTPTSLKLVEACVDKVIDEIPDHAFTGLSTKGRIGVTTSACIEHTRKLGGTIQGIQDIVNVGKQGIKAPIRDLDTGKVVDTKSLEDLTTGEYIFWTCLDHVLKTPPPVLRRAHMLVVKEPGKGRTVTKGFSFLKIILDFVGRICSHPLAKGLESSMSGMAKSNQAWQFFKLMMSNHEDDIFFNVHSRSFEEFAGGSRHETVTYNDVFLSSTDFETATDAIDHKVASIIGRKWMMRCGIPPLLRHIVMEIAYKPRQIQFNGSGWIGSLGSETRGGLRLITLRRGILMGDPMTKPVLHLLNAAIREIPTVLKDYGILSRYFSNAGEIAKLSNDFRG